MWCETVFTKQSNAYSKFRPITERAPTQSHKCRRTADALLFSMKEKTTNVAEHVVYVRAQPGTTDSNQMYRLELRP